MTKDNSARIWLLLAPALLFGQPAAALAVASYAGNSYSTPVIQCAIDSVSGAFTEAQSQYTVKGDCEESSGTSTGAAFNWTAVGIYQPGTHNVSETISVSKASNQFTVPVAFTLSATMVCGQDPWRQPDGLSCGSVRYQAPNSQDLTQPENDILNSLYAKAPVVPRSSVLTAQQRAALNQQYQRQLVSLNSRNKPALTPSKLPGGASATVPNPANANRVVLASAPVITLPVANSNNVEGRFQVKARIAGSYTGAEGVYVQFTYLGNATAPNQNSFVNTFNTSLKDLVNGITIPNYITRGGQGRWLVRAEIVSPNAGPWSAAVPFTLTALSSTNVPSNLNKK